MALREVAADLLENVLNPFFNLISMRQLMAPRFHGGIECYGIVGLYKSQK